MHDGDRDAANEKPGGDVSVFRLWGVFDESAESSGCRGVQRAGNGGCHRFRCRVRIFGRQLRWGDRVFVGPRGESGDLPHASGRLWAHAPHPQGRQGRLPCLFAGWEEDRVLRLRGLDDLVDQRDGLRWSKPDQADERSGRSGCRTDLVTRRIFHCLHERSKRRVRTLGDGFGRRPPKAARRSSSTHSGMTP